MAKIEDIKIKIDASDLGFLVKVICSNRECLHNDYINLKISCNLKKIHIDEFGGCLNRTTEE